MSVAMGRVYGLVAAGAAWQHSLGPSPGEHTTERFRCLLCFAAPAREPVPVVQPRLAGRGSGYRPTPDSLGTGRLLRDGRLPGVSW